MKFMRLSLRLSVLFLFIIFFSIFVGAYGTYGSFYITKEVNSDSFFIEAGEVENFNQASIIYALVPSGKQGIVIQLKRTTGDFSDLYEYIRNSQIETANLYSYDDFDYFEFGKNLRQSTGINVIVDSGRSARDRYQIQEALEEISNQVEQEEINQTTKPTNIQIPPGNKLIATGEVTLEKESNHLILASSIIAFAIIIGFVILAFVLKKR